MELSTDNSFLHKVGIFVSVIFTSFYFFPFEFKFLPGINTKMAMAGIGLICLFFNLAKRREGFIDNHFFSLSVYALAISFISYVSVVYNGTNDYSFVGYIISMWVWVGGAYAWVLWIKQIHGFISVRLIVNYLLTVCTIQCIIAYTINVYPPLADFVDSFLGGEAFMGKAEGRLYGIGCALDVSGFRFSAVLVMTTYVCLHEKAELIRKNIGLYLIGFFVVVIIGNMMSRSTTIGLSIALAYAGYVVLFRKNEPINSFVFRWFGGILLVGLPVLVYLYNYDEAFYTNIRFGFEGFFSLVEKGSWEVSSNDILLDHMIRFPETLKTWIIGDGYAANPDRDPYYLGPKWHGFYMATDIGYLRFIFYFGLIGALAFVVFISKTAFICMKKHPHYKMFFILLLLVNLIGWFKVTSDIFLMFTPFLCFTQEEESLDGEEETNLIES